MGNEVEAVKRILNCIESRDVEKDWNLEAAFVSGVVEAPAELPSTVDLREPLWWKIGDQGQTGSCVGWATADAVLRWHFVKAKRLQSDKLLSVRFAWMAAKEFDEFRSWPTTFIELAGTSLKAALEVAWRYGAVTEDTLPFDHQYMYPNDENMFYAIASRLRIASFYNVGANPENWKKWLASNGPILTRLTVDNTWRNATQTGGKLQTYDRASAAGGHAVAIVGYTPDAFIVRNSWGEYWGDKGFAHASYAYAMGAFTEAYGVLV